MLFCIFFVLIHFTTSFDLTELWKDIFIENSSKFLQNVTSGCKNDTYLWISSLKKFSNISKECIIFTKCSKEDQQLIMDNLFAVKQLDAFGKIPSTGLMNLPLLFDGSYDECEHVSGIKYETNYCYLSLFSPRININSTFPLTLRSAVCMPKSCNSQDLISIFNQNIYIPLKAQSAACVHNDIAKDSAFWGFSFFLIFISLVIISASIIDFIRDTVYEIPSSRKTNIGFQAILSFSLWTNSNLILSVKEQQFGFIKSLDCIRFFSMVWVVTGHVYIFLMPPDTLSSFSDVFKYFWNHLILNAFLSVDTFFVLSGIVVSYLFFKSRPKLSTIKNPLTWILFYLHRYLRLTPPIMLFIGFYIVYGNYIQGPFSAAGLNQISEQIEVCKKYWWKNLLYINNFGDLDKSCYLLTWYLAVDTQLYIIAPIFLIGFYFSIKSGIVLIIIGCSGSVLITYILFGKYDIQADPFGNGNNSHFFDMIYMKPWIRCPPYLIGILTGYFIAVYGKRTIHLNRVLNIACWISALLISTACLFSTYDYDKGSYWSIFSRATYYNFSRIGWSFAVCWVIAANHMGWGGPIQNFMSHPIWQPFGRLSYCVYIVHWFILFYSFNVSGKFPHFYSTWQAFICYAVPAIFLSYIFAFFWSCLFEIPILKLEKLLIQSLFGDSGKNTIDEENEKKYNNKNSELWDVKL